MSKLAKSLMMGAAGAGGGPLYVEDVFSTYLYDGNSTARSITNGLDLSGEGGLVWIKTRTHPNSHRLFDTERGANNKLATQSAEAAASVTNELTAFNSDGFSLGTQPVVNVTTYDGVNQATFASWSFRKAEKFFDVVTYTGNGTNQDIPHNLGSVPGCIIVKSLNPSDWVVYHRSVGASNALKLNGTEAQFGISDNPWADTVPTSTTFRVADVYTSSRHVNINNVTYVAYLFAHDAGGFGNDGTESVIKCGGYSGNGSSQEINLGFEPQWCLIKVASGETDDWYIFDQMRGWNVINDNQLTLRPNRDYADSPSLVVNPTATGFKLPSVDLNKSGKTYIYIAIRRGPMKTPTDATEVFRAVEYSGNSNANLITTGLDMRGGGGRLHWIKILTGSNNGTGYAILNDLTGSQYLDSSTSSAESSLNIDWGVQDWIKHNSGPWNTSGNTIISWNFRRSPGFFDMVAWSGDGSSNRAINHNLGVVPELIIAKRRTNLDSWLVTTPDLAPNAEGFFLNTDQAKITGISALIGTSAPSSTAFYVSSNDFINGSGDTYIAYLFATVPGVSKVGSYTGTGSDINVDCGFISGSRFILIKRTDTRITTGFETNWYVWDHVRGIVSGNDNSLELNTADPQKNNDWIDPLNAGFTVTSSAPAALNTSGGTYIFLAIA